VRRWRSLALVVAGLSLLSIPAAGVWSFQIVGFSAQRFQGNSGLLAMTTACQSQFPASRVCSSSEVANTVKLPGPLPGGLAWVQPVMVGGENGASVDQSGGIVPGTVPCTGWTNNSSGVFGVATSATGQLAVTTCDQLLSVACCAFSPVPEPPTSLAEPAAGVALASLLAGRAACSAF